GRRPHAPVLLAPARRHALPVAHGRGRPAQGLVLVARRQPGVAHARHRGASARGDERDARRRPPVRGAQRGRRHRLDLRPPRPRAPPYRILNGRPRLWRAPSSPVAGRVIQSPPTRVATLHGGCMVTGRRASIAVLAFIVVAGSVRADQGLLGFSDERARAQRALEQRFDASLRASDLRDWMKRLAARPHHLGSPYGKENAEFIASLFRSWGYDTRVEEFRVLFPTPKARVLEMVEPTRFVAAISEPVLKEDATSGQSAEQLPVFNAYSIDGDVTAPLVYVNYGVPRDYEELARRGVDVKGKVVLARYGGSWRGIKPKVAAEHGAIACLIYSDPRADAYFEGDVYPEGAYRNERGAQRGSVADMPLFPGDPLTPGVGATADAKRLSLSEAPTLTKIPVMPISYADAQPLLRALRGPLAPEAWRGALPLTYHLGPGPTKVHLKLAFNWNQVPAYDVIARLAGGERPDEWIVRGNHHDAWVNGANDPISGLVPLLAEAKAIGELHKSGWTPKRTIVFAAWDGEEPGLLGSTEWAEAHADELRQKAAVYINTDGNGRGFLGVGGSHTLERFINEVARDVIDPQTKVSVAERARARRLLDARADDRKDVRDRRDLRIS